MFSGNLSCPYRELCKVSEYSNCPKNINNCGLYIFLNMINSQSQKFSQSSTDLLLMNELREIYVEAWNKYASSRARGGATGKAFQNWIVSKLRTYGLHVKENQRVVFDFGEFKVDAVIPSPTDPVVILEIKISIDTQHLLSLEGLMYHMLNPKTRLGLVTLYEIRSSVHRNLINIIKRRFSEKFEYFHLENGWVNELERLVSFCRIYTKYS